MDYAHEEEYMIDFSGKVVSYKTSARVCRSMTHILQSMKVLVQPWRKIFVSQNWFIILNRHIYPEKALHTVHKTNQGGIITVHHPSLSCQFRKDDRNLRYHQLSHSTFGDTMLLKQITNVEIIVMSYLAHHLDGHKLLRQKIKSRLIKWLITSSPYYRWLKRTNWIRVP